jgi:hypothetical protein
MVRISETLKGRLVKLASKLFPYNNKAFEVESVGVNFSKFCICHVDNLPEHAKLKSSKQPHN